MKSVLIIGSGISGLTCAIETAKKGFKAIIVSPYPPERSQSVMAAGGINAVLPVCDDGDSIDLHIKETIESGCHIGGIKAVKALCSDAPYIIEWLESIGVIFSRDKNGNSARRAFGGQSCKRTVYAGASTGKQIVTALIREARKWECKGRIERRLGLLFHSAFIHNGIFMGALFYDQMSDNFEPIYADATVFATGGQNCLFGKTTGSSLCDGYSAGRLFTQGVKLKNLEFIQYHPTTIETSQKRMLITEGARGDGGRLYYIKNNKPVYFMEEKYGEKGNLMPRDIVSKCIYDAPSQVYLDISFLGKSRIMSNLREVYDLCNEYMGLDVTKEPIPVSPSVHFFMGGIAVDIHHRTNIERLYAIGECASIYHGANRLGGNSLLAAIYSGRAAADSIAEEDKSVTYHNFDSYIKQQEKILTSFSGGKNSCNAIDIQNSLVRIMNEDLGILRTGSKLLSGIDNIDEILSQCVEITGDNRTLPYTRYSLRSMVILGRAILTCSENRRETRGAHIRDDYPETLKAYENCTIISYDDGKYNVTYGKEDEL